ncbi:MAG: 2OG-Fe(II) oxygenase [Terricaulis sp.]
MTKRLLSLGEPVSLPHLLSYRNPRFAFGSLGGRFVLLCVVLDPTRADARAAIAALEEAKVNGKTHVVGLFCGDASAFEDTGLKAIDQSKLVLFDKDRETIREWRLLDEAAEPGGKWVLLDPSLRVLGLWPIQKSAEALAALANAPHPNEHAGVPLHAPVLIAPRIFEPAFCQALIAAYERNGGRPSGTTKESLDGKTYVSLDNDFKRRADYTIEDETIRNDAMHRIYWRLLPQIEKAFSFRATRMERYIVACYDAASGGFFRAHRDNTTKGTAHRRFAVTINLNAEDYDGGDLSFPEYGSRSYRAPTGGAVVFSCSLLHEATPVTRGKRYAFLPFLYDDAAAKLRAENAKYLDDSIGGYSNEQ